MSGIPIKITPSSGIPIRNQDNAVNKAVVSDRPDAIAVHIADYGTPFVVEGLSAEWDVSPFNGEIIVYSMPDVDTPVVSAGNGQVVVTGYN